MEDPVKGIFKLNLIILRLLGFYPPQKYKRMYQIYACAVYLCITIPVPTLAAVHLVVGEDIDMAQFGDSSFIIFQLGCFIFKSVPFVFNADEIRRTILMLKQPMFNNYSVKQEKIIQDSVKVCKRNTWLFLALCTAAVIFWAPMPFMGGSHKFPIEIWLPYNPTSDTKTYVLTYIFKLLGVGHGAVSNGAIDTLVAGMAYQAATQLRLLKNKLERLGVDAEEEITINFDCNLDLQERDDLKNGIIFEKVRQCVNHHDAILKFIADYEDVYSCVVFTQFMAASTVICVCVFQLSMVEPFTFTFFFMIIFLLTMLLEIFLYCYFGSILFEESNSLTTAIYMGTWYEYDHKSKKALIVLMERSKRPMIVRAGKILELSLVTFTMILRRSYSLLTVLQNFKNDV